MQLPNVPEPWALPEDVARRLFDEGVVLISGALDATKADQAIVQLLAMDVDRSDPVPTRPITLQLNGVTGSIGAALALHDVIATMRTPVHVVAGGSMDTAGLLVVAAGTRGHRRLLPTARAHLRRPTEPTIEGLPLESAAQEVDLLRDRATEILGTPLHPPRMLVADEIIQLGIADATPGE